MSDLKVVLYKENNSPRSLQLNSRTVYRLIMLISSLSLLLLVSIGLAVRFYLVSPKSHGQQSAEASLQDAAPTNSDASSPEEKNKLLQDQVDLLNQKIANQIATSNASKDIDKNNPALALFAPIIVDKSKNNEIVQISNISIVQASGRNPATLSFELHNPKPEDGSQKGYIVVVARSEKTLYSYPNVFTTSGPYLLDFEKGETFQIARFRMVNAQFDIPTVPDSYQIFIFSRSGELWINRLYEIKRGSDN